MKEAFYVELRNRIEEIRQVENESSSVNGFRLTESGMMLIDTIEKLQELANVARHDGLLMLEESAMQMEEFPGAKYLQFMLMLVVDGTDPEELEELVLSRYYTSTLHDYQAVQYLIMLYGSLAIQKLVNPRILIEGLKYLLPEEISDIYDQVLKEREREEDHEKPEPVREKMDMSIVEKLCEDQPAEGSKSALEPGDDYYYIVKMLEEAMSQVDDRVIQRILRDVENADLCMAMKILNGKIRRSIFNNLSERLAIMIAEEMIFMGPVRLVDAGEACVKIFTVFLKLIESGEIYYAEELMLKEMAVIFLRKQEEKNAVEIRKSEDKLYRLWQEYLNHSNRRVGGSD